MRMNSGESLIPDLILHSQMIYLLLWGLNRIDLKPVMDIFRVIKMIALKGSINYGKLKHSLKSQIWKRQNHSLKAAIFIGTQVFLSGVQNPLLRQWKLFCSISVLPLMEGGLFPELLKILPL